MPKFQYCLRSVYGTFKRYPVNQAAHQFADLLGSKTFTGGELNQIQALGFEVEQVGDPVAQAAAQAEVSA